MLPYYIIAILVGMALLIAFLFVILKKLSERTGSLIRSSVLKELSVYDHVLGRKLNEALAMNADKDAQTSARVVPEVRESAAARLDTSALLTVQGGTYRNETFLRDYRCVKELSVTDMPAVIAEVRSRAADDPRYLRGRAAAGILEKFPQSLLYELITLPEDEQKALILSQLSADERALFDDYLLMTRDFDPAAFLDAMEGEAHAGSDDMTVYTGDPQADYAACGADITTVYDPSICEGVRIAYRNKLYDFCLLHREVM